MMRSNASKVLVEVHFCESEQIVASSANRVAKDYKLITNSLPLGNETYWALSQLFRVGALLRTLFIWYQDGKIENSPRR